MLEPSWQEELQPLCCVSVFPVSFARMLHLKVVTVFWR